MEIRPSASYSLSVRIAMPSRPGMLGRIATAIGEEGGTIGSIDIVEVGGGRTVRDITIATRGEEHERAIVARLSRLDDMQVDRALDRTFLAHLGGKIEVQGRLPVKTRDDLSMVYTPGVGRVCMAIAEEPERQWALTAKRHLVAVVTDGTAVLGLGDIGPAAAQPVMEGKCVLFKTFGGVDAFPICLATKDPDEIVATVQRIAPVFGGINLEDIAAPKCFEIERRLRETLDIPVMHDDQHGTAVVVLAALTNALKLVGKSMARAKIVIAGAGAAGVAVARILGHAGARRIVLCDRTGAIYPDRPSGMNEAKRAVALETNPDREVGRLSDVIVGADVFIGLSGPGVLGTAEVASMAHDSVVFALANPVPEVQPEELEGIVRVIATGRSDYANQINNSLGFPGIFRGALDVQATDINEQMLVAAAEAIAGLVADDELHEDYIIPSMFDSRVADAVAAATRRAARLSGVSRLEGSASEPAGDLTSAEVARAPRVPAALVC